MKPKAPIRLGVSALAVGGVIALFVRGLAPKTNPSTVSLTPPSSLVFGRHQLNTVEHLDLIEKAITEHEDMRIQPMSDQLVSESMQMARRVMFPSPESWTKGVAEYGWTKGAEEALKLDEAGWSQQLSTQRKVFADAEIEPAGVTVRPWTTLKHLDRKPFGDRSTVFVYASAQVRYPEPPESAKAIEVLLPMRITPLLASPGDNRAVPKVPCYFAIGLWYDDNVKRWRPASTRVYIDQPMTGLAMPLLKY